MKSGSYAIFLITAFFFSACSTSTERFPQKPFASTESGNLISSLKKRNDKLQTFKGIGKIKFWNNGKPQYARMAWLGLQPGNLRIEILGTPGHRTVSFASDGKWIYFLSHTDQRFHKKRLTDASLEKIISIPVKLNDIYAFLSGRVPIQEHDYAGVEKNKSHGGFVLVLKKGGQDVLEKLYIDKNEITVRKVEMFDSTGFLLYQASFDRMKNIKGYEIPFRLVISNEEEVLFKLEIERYWADVSVSPSMFVLTPPE